MRMTAAVCTLISSRIVASSVPLPSSYITRARSTRRLSGRRQHDVAVALALFNADQHAAAVDIADLQVHDFGDPQPGGIARRLAYSNRSSSRSWHTYDRR